MVRCPSNMESMGVANLQTARQALICIDFHSFLLQLKQFVTQSLVSSLKYVRNQKSERCWESETFVVISTRVIAKIAFKNNLSSNENSNF